MRGPSPSAQAPASGSGASRGVSAVPGGRCGAGGARVPTGGDDDVGRSADHQQMLDIVAPHQHQAPPTINGRGINDRQAGHAPAIGTGTEAIIGKSANQPGGGADQGQHGHEG